jgi:formamidopyrimidine-DNA glycosylase
MPEFYEVYRMKAYLDDAKILNKKIIAVEIPTLGARCFKSHTKENAKAFFLNNSMTSIQTIAKYTIFNFKQGAMLCHYRFTGVPHIVGKSYTNRVLSIHSLPLTNYSKKHVRFSLVFEDNQQLDYVDTRCLSHIHINPKENSVAAFKSKLPCLQDLNNYKPLTFREFTNVIKTSKQDIKIYLQNQLTPPSGIGNYLACEICHGAKLSPFQTISSLTKMQYNALVTSIKKIHEICISRADYNWFCVYHKQRCGTCNSPINHQKHSHKNSQTTWWCPQCVLA